MQITFDFQQPCKLSHALFYGDEKPVAVLVSETGQEGSWQPLASVAAPRREGETTPDKGAFFDLRGTKGRYVRLDIQTGGEGIRMGEVKVFGWPVAP